MKTRPPHPVSSILETAAAAALGGEPVRPPALKAQPIKRADAGVVTRGEDARQRFQSAATAPVFGNSTFDGPPPALLMRRGKAEVVRRKLAALAKQITAEHETITGLLDDLGDDAADLKAAEHFDVETARKFIADLKAVVDGVAKTDTEAPAPPAEVEDLKEMPAE